MSYLQAAALLVDLGTAGVSTLSFYDTFLARFLIQNIHHHVSIFARSLQNQGKIQIEGFFLDTMALPSTALSQTLKSITITKFKELNKQKSNYESSKLKILQAVDAAGDNSRARISRLLDGMKDATPSNNDDFEKKVVRWIEQSRYDATVPDHLLAKWEQQLRKKLDVQSKRLSLAELYSRLLTDFVLLHFMLILIHYTNCPSKPA